MFVVTNICRDKSFVATKIFCGDKHNFVVTKVILSLVATWLVAIWLAIIGLVVIWLAIIWLVAIWLVVIWGVVIWLAIIGLAVIWLAMIWLAVLGLVVIWLAMIWVVVIHFTERYAVSGFQQSNFSLMHIPKTADAEVQNGFVRAAVTHSGTQDYRS